MKQIFLLSTVIALFSLTTSGQIKKGSLHLGGQFSYYNSKVVYNTSQPEQKFNSGNYNISAGTALKENSVLGLYIGYGHYYFKDSSNYYSKIKDDRYNIGVFYRQYKRLAKDFYFFGELGGGYIGSNRTYVSGPGNVTTKYAQSGAGLSLTPGISYRIYKKLQVELSIPQIAGVQYAVIKTTSLVNNSKEDQFSFNTNLNSSLLNNLGLGFRFVF